MVMRVISNKALTTFAMSHPDAAMPLQAWRKIIESRSFVSFADLKSMFNATDKVGDYYVFNIAGNKYRIISAVHFGSQKLFVRHVFTHREYDKWTP